MHFNTEAPITSFFPRIAASKKRKIHTELAPSGSSNKWRGDHSRQGFKSRVNEDEQEGHNTLDNGTIPILHSPFANNLSTTRLTRQQTNERHMPLRKDVAPHTPNPNRLPSRKKRKISLQTPPPTDEAQRLMELTPTLSPFISRESSDLRIEKVQLPTPSTLGRSASHHNGHSGNERCRVTQDLSSPARPKSSDTSPKVVPVSIPSSQSQLMANSNSYSEEKHRLMPASTVLPYGQLLQYEVQLSPTNKITLNRRDKGDSKYHESQMFISSSQSQLLSPLDEHNHLQPSLIASNPELDIIPSSQSQEKELRILSDPEECHQPIHSRKQALPQPTRSDELFSVSILQTGWTEYSLDSEQPAQVTSDIHCVVNHGDDSVTECETEPETGEDSYYRNHCLTPMQPQPCRFSQLPLADIASFNEDSEHRDSRDSQQSSQESSLANQTSLFAFLPSAVKEFQSMFGSDEDSYPPDFPMSLR